MTNLEDILTTERVITKSAAHTKKHALELVSKLISHELPEHSYQTVFDKFIAREKLGSTAIGGDAAIPHIQLPSLKTPIGIFIHLKQPIAFGAGASENTADLIFALAAPEEKPEEHSALLNTINKIFNDENTCKNLRATTTSKEIIEIISRARQ